jgi:hypothetical protein
MHRTHNTASALVSNRTLAEPGPTNVISTGIGRPLVRVSAEMGLNC